MAEDTTPQLSVVIIGRNEGQRLIACIESVQAMASPFEQIEIIYVDSDSTDGSPEHAATLGVQVITVHPERPAAAIGRNAGWRAARAPLVLFLDGDTLLHPQFVDAAWQVLQQQPQVAIVWGHRRERHPERSWYQCVLDLDWIYPPGKSDFCGGDALMRRAVLAEVDGYDPNLIAGEEPEMCQRIRTGGHVVWHIDHPMTLHDLAIHRWGQYWRRAIRAGYAYAEVSNRLKNSAFPLWQAEAKRNLLHASALLSVVVLGVGVSLGLGSVLPLLLSLGLLSALVLRSAWKSRWKSNNTLTLLVYGLHSQFQHIPIAMGQLSYYWHHWRGQRRELIEYK